jgi:hypothetical protein
MVPVLHLNPIAGARPVASLPVLGDDPLEPHPAGGGEQVRPDLATLERRHEDALLPAAQELVELPLAVEERGIPQVLAAERHQIEGIELCLVVVLVRMRASKSEMPWTSSTQISPSMMNWLWRIFSAVSTIQGKRQVQSSPLRESSLTFLPSRTIRPR